MPLGKQTSPEETAQYNADVEFVVERIKELVPAPEGKHIGALLDALDDAGAHIIDGLFERWFGMPYSRERLIRQEWKTIGVTPKS